MTIYKSKDITTNIESEKLSINNSNTSFYTEDKGSAALRIFIKYRDGAFNLNDTNLTPTLDLFHNDGSIWRDEPLEVIMSDKGLLQYNIPNNVIAHAGRIKAKLFLKNTEQSVHVSNFTFDIKDSGIEGAVAKEISVNLVDNAVRRIVKENAIEILGDDFEKRLNEDVINHLDSNPELFKGDKGDKGDVGPQGIQGKQGVKGEQGEQGIKGDTGPQGIQGPRGEKGEQGIRGPKGDTGERGLDGKSLVYDSLTQEQKEDLKSNITDQAVTDFVLKDGDVTTNKIANKAVTPDKTNFVISGKNKFDKNKVLIGKVLHNNNTMVDSPSYDVSHDIALTKNEQITISKLRNYNFINTGTNEIIADTTTRTNYTFTAPSNGIFKFTLFHADLDSTQVESGNIATAYEPYYLKLSDDITLNKVEVDSTSNYVLNKNANNIDIITLLNGKNLEVRTIKNGSKNDSFNFDRTIYDGNTVHGTSDDITPVRTFTTVGANHGYTSIIEVPNNDKVKADLGSTWTDGTTEYVLLRIVSNMLIFGLPYNDSKGYVTSVQSPSVPKANLTHVSGATNKNAIPVTGTKTTTQLYPSTGKIEVTYLADKNIVDKDGTYKCNTVTIIENYEILDYKSIIEFSKNNIGKDYADYRNTIQGVLSMSNTFHYYDRGKCTTSHSIRPLQKVLMGRTGVLQSVYLEHPTLPSYRFVPNLGTVGNVDFTKPINLANYNVSSYIYRDNLIDATKPTDRYIDYITKNDKIELAFTMGHIVDKTNSKYEDRLKNIPNILWDFRSTKKSYPTVLENKIIDVGEYYNFQGYRNYYVPKNGVINSNTVVDSQSIYIYIDAINESSFKATNFPELIGSQVEVIASSGFDLKTNIIDSNGLNYSITKPNGYAILKTI